LQQTVSTRSFIGSYSWSNINLSFLLVGRCVFACLNHTTPCRYVNQWCQWIELISIDNNNHYIVVFILLKVTALARLGCPSILVRNQFVRRRYLLTYSMHSRPIQSQVVCQQVYKIPVRCWRRERDCWVSYPRLLARCCLFGESGILIVLMSHCRQVWLYWAHLR
jgi:hypothetical protein